MGLGEMGGAKWVMQKTMHYIRRRFYNEPDSRSRNSSQGSLDSNGSSSSSSGSSTSSGTSSSQTSSSSNSSRRNQRSSKLPLYKPIPDHYPQFCEACMLGRCIFPPRQD